MGSAAETLFNALKCDGSAVVCEYSVGTHVVIHKNVGFPEVQNEFVGCSRNFPEFPKDYECQVGYANDEVHTFFDSSSTTMLLVGGDVSTKLFGLLQLPLVQGWKKGNGFSCTSPASSLPGQSTPYQCSLDVNN